MSCEATPDYTAASLAKRAGVSTSYVARLCRVGTIPATKVVGAVWVIARDVGDAWLARHKRKAR